jgi:hypothetical protein
VKTIEFDRYFPKLNDDIFSTIRKPEKKVKMGTWYRISTKVQGEFKAMCINGGVCRLGEIPEEYLLKDTNTSSKEEALDLLRTFYPDLEIQHKVSFWWFAKPGAEVGESGVGPFTIGDAP